MRKVNQLAALASSIKRNVIGRVSPLPFPFFALRLTRDCGSFLDFPPLERRFRSTKRISMGNWEWREKKKNLSASFELGQWILPSPHSIPKRRDYHFLDIYLRVSALVFEKPLSWLLRRRISHTLHPAPLASSNTGTFVVDK